jgi:taurine dioxygenase
MTIKVTPTNSYYGAYVRGVDFSSEISDDAITEIKNLWAKYQVLIFPDQILTCENLERFILYFGTYCQDPYIQPINGYQYVAEVRREKDEITEIFAEGWHSDWFHMQVPPKGTALYAVKIPPAGGDTLFSDQYTAYTDLSADLKYIVDNQVGINSARRGYAPDGRYGIKDTGRSMKLIYSEDAYAIQKHPLCNVHPETGRKVINCNRGYTMGIEGMPSEESMPILLKIFQHQGNEKYVYRHRWNIGDLVLWDNRSTLHKATGNYEGYQRIMYRVTIG